MEITLGNVTASKPGHPVHLAWWAPRKSETVWNPHISLAGAGILEGRVGVAPVSVFI